MKLLLTVLTIFYTFHTTAGKIENNHKIRRQFVWECIRETQIPWSAILKLKSGDFVGHNQKSKDFVKCFGIKVGMIDEETEEIVEEMVIKYLLTITKFPLIIPEIIENCRDSVDPGNNLSDYAFNCFECFSSYTEQRPDILDDTESIFDAVLAEAQNLKLTWIRKFEMNENIDEWFEEIQDIDNP